MFAIFGLGNVGKEYDNTYHNLGFIVLDAFAKKHGISFSKKKCNAMFGEGKIFGKKVMLFKPTTFMNNSGFSVADAVKKFKIEKNHLMVVFDDVDIPVSEIRIKEKGSAGSHNGIKSIIQNLGHNEFARIKVGIGSKYYNLVDYVLSKISKEHAQQFESVIENACILLEEFIKNDGEVNRVH